jgi:hypothetical protein
MLTSFFMLCLVTEYLPAIYVLLKRFVIINYFN